MKTGRRVGLILLPSGERVDPLVLVEKMRQFRGRLPRPLLCIAMGWPKSPEWMAIVHRLCVDYEITTADRPFEPRGHRSTDAAEAKRAIDLEKLARAEQIRLAREEAKTAPLFKTGSLEF